MTDRAQHPLASMVPFLALHELRNSNTLAAEAIGRGPIALQYCRREGDAARLRVIEALSRSRQVVGSLEKFIAQPLVFAVHDGRVA